MESQTDPTTVVTVSLIPVLIIFLLLAFVMSKLAPRVGGSAVTWFILTIIPAVNVFFLYYAVYRIIAHILDRLNELSARSSRPV